MEMETKEGPPRSIPRGERLATRRRLLLLGAATLLACSEQPMDPGQQQPPVETPAVTTIEVTSPAGEIIAVTGSVQLTAAAYDQEGRPITATFAWTVADGAVATVSAAGVVTGVGAGATTVAAAANGVRGTLDLTIAETDLAAIQRLLDDPHAERLLASIGGATETALRASWAQCGSARAAGDLASIRDCITQARADMAQSADASKGPLVALLSLFVDWIDRLLNLA